ncbi:MAG: YajQ family cyclic di-GMP-binding protein [Oleispira sp.]|nr:YajQ family cyclic di-GMP-binding protein [Oleispira sp.]MBL4799741.1 YajQ family cyclic di-GMP-binding protein [Oleispira sp.]MBL4880762.1 YajQ family cyclic di-GMP-binding protein [Oleispira sp.]
MPSFDIVSEIEKHEAQNAVDSANREITTRFDFKGVNASFELKDKEVMMTANEEFQIEQMKPMLEANLIKRKIKVSCLEYEKLMGAGKQVKMAAVLRQGIDKDLGRIINKKIKESKIKVTSAVQGEMVRVTGKKRDELQQVMQMLKADEEIELPLMFKNFKD